MSAATGVDPKDGIATANQILSAFALLNEGKPERAATVLQPVLADGAKMYLTQFVMGAALARQQQYPQALGYLRHAIELQPDSTWAHYEMGSSLLNSGDYKTAVIHLEIASNIWDELRTLSANAPNRPRRRGPSCSWPCLPDPLRPAQGLSPNARMSITLVDLWKRFVYIRS